MAEYTVEHPALHFATNEGLEHQEKGSVIELTEEQAERLGSKVKLKEPEKKAKAKK